VGKGSLWEGESRWRKRLTFLSRASAPLLLLLFVLLLLLLFTPILLPGLCLPLSIAVDVSREREEGRHLGVEVQVEGKVAVVMEKIHLHRAEEGREGAAE
jgi:uncharacterized protein (DUF58 family)